MNYFRIELPNGMFLSIKPGRNPLAFQVWAVDQFAKAAERLIKEGRGGN